MKRIILAIFSALIVAGCGDEKATKPQEKPTTAATAVRVAPIRGEESAQAILAPGVVFSETEQRLSFKTGGIIDKIWVQEGAVVRPGQLLATLNLTEINAQVAQAKEAVAKAERDLARVKNLYADSVATKEQFQNAQTGVTIAQQNLTIAQFNQSYSEIRATIGGKIIRKLMNEGELTGPGTPVFFLQSLAANDWVIKVGLADRDWARVRTGDRAEVRLDAYPGEVIQTRVGEVADIGDPQTSTFKVEVRLPAGNKKLASGLIGSVQIFPQQQGTRRAIPIDALVESNNAEAWVFTAENGVAHRQRVRIAYLQGDLVILASGLENAREVITSGAPYLKEGQAVQVISAF